MSIYIDSLKSGEDENHQKTTKPEKKLTKLAESPHEQDDNQTLSKKPSLTEPSTITARKQSLTAPPAAKRAKLDRSKYGKFIIVFRKWILCYLNSQH